METEVQRFITLIEPVILVVMGAVIALVVLALYMPAVRTELGGAVIGMYGYLSINESNEPRYTPEDYSEKSPARGSSRSAITSSSST